MEFQKKLAYYFLFLSLFSTGCRTTQEKVRENAIPEETKVQEPEKETFGLNLRDVKGMEDMKILSLENPESEKENDNLIYFHIPIGGQTSMECTFIRGNDSPVYILKNLIGKIKSNPGVEAFEILNLDSGVMGRVPFVSLEGEYEMGGEKSKMKAVALASLGFVMLCYHDETGFNEAFQASVLSISKSGFIEKQLSRIRKYTSRNIQSVKLNGSNIGYSENFIFSSGKIINYYSVSNYLIPHGKDDAYAGEIIEDVYALDSNGNLSRGEYYSSQNNVNDYHLSLVETGPGVYEVKGTVKGEPFDKTVSSVSSSVQVLDFELARLSRDGRKHKGKKYQILQFHPTIPDKLVDSTLELTGFENGVAAISFSSGSVVLNYLQDDSGVLGISMDNQKIKMTWERIFHENN